MRLTRWPSSRSSAVGLPLPPPAGADAAPPPTMARSCVDLLRTTYYSLLTTYYLLLTIYYLLLLTTYNLLLTTAYYLLLTTYYLEHGAPCACPSQPLGRQLSHTLSGGWQGLLGKVLPTTLQRCEATTKPPQLGRVGKEGAEGCAQERFVKQLRLRKQRGCEGACPPSIPSTHSTHSTPSTHSTHSCWAPHSLEPRASPHGGCAEWVRRTTYYLLLTTYYLLLTIRMGEAPTTNK